MDIATSFTKLVDGDLPAMETHFTNKTSFANRKPGDEEARYLLRFQGASPGRSPGIPFYPLSLKNGDFPERPPLHGETGEGEKNPLSQADVVITSSILRKLQPHRIYYSAGDIADPRGTRSLSGCDSPCLQHHRPGRVVKD